MTSANNWENNSGKSDAELSGREQSERLTRGRIFAERGRQHYYNNNYTEALSQLTQALEMGITDPWVLTLRGGALRELYRHDEALIDLTRAITLDSQDSLAFTLRAMTLRALGRY